MRVLITGITGYIGSRLARRLAAGHEVYGLVRCPLNCTYIEDIRNKVKFYEIDGSYRSVETALKEVQPDLVYHLAACYTQAHGAEQTPALVDANIVFGAYLLEAMSACECRALVYASTVMAYAEKPAELAEMATAEINAMELTTAAGYRPLNLYAATKQAFSDLLAYYTDAGYLRAVTLVLSDTYGPGDQRPKILNLIKRAAETGQRLELSDGGQDYDAVYIDDVTEAFRLAGQRILKRENRLDSETAAQQTVQNETFQVCAAAPLTLKATVDRLLQINESKVDIVWGARKPSPREIRRAVRRYPRMPGWQLRVSLEEGLQRFWQ